MKTPNRNNPVKTKKPIMKKRKIKERVCCQHFDSETLLKKQSKSNILEFSIREHNAEDAGKHLDLVIGSPNSDYVADFFIPKTDLEKEKRLALESDPHSTEKFLLDEVGNEHKIKKGYGKGTWTTTIKGTAKKTGEDEYTLTSKDHKFKFLKFKSDPKKWLIIDIK